MGAALTAQLDRLEADPETDIEQALDLESRVREYVEIVAAHRCVQAYRPAMLTRT